MRLQPGCLIGHQGIAGGMALIKGIFGKFQPILPDFIDHRGWHTVFGSTFHDLFLKLHHQIYVLLTHGFAQSIRFAAAEPAQFARDLHHLFLIDGNAIGAFEGVFHQGMIVGDLFLAVFARDIAVDELHRSRPVERHHGDQILKHIGLQFHQILAHAVTFKLEYAVGFAPAEHGVHFFIIQRQAVDIDLGAMALSDQIDAFFDQSKRLQPQYIHLQHLQFVQPFPFVLHQDHLLAILLDAAGQGHIIGKISRGDHHPRGMNPGLADQPFQHDRMFQDALIQLILIDQIAKLRILLQRVFQALHHAGDGLGDDIGFGCRYRKHTRHVLDHAFRAQSSEGDDLRNALAVKLLYDVVDHSAPALGAEINVDIRHADAVGIQETLEHQSIFEGIYLCDIQEIGDDAASRGTAPRSHRNVLFARVVDDILHHQEIALKAHPLDYSKFVIDTVGNFCTHLRILDLGGFIAEMTQPIAHLRIVWWRIYLGQ